MTLDLEAIRKRVRRAQVYGLPEAAKPVLAEDVPALLAEVERLEAVVERQSITGWRNRAEQAEAERDAALAAAVWFERQLASVTGDDYTDHMPDTSALAARDAETRRRALEAAATEAEADQFHDDRGDVLSSDEVSYNAARREAAAAIRALAEKGTDRG